MKTSYFGNRQVWLDPRAVSIARWPPRGWGKRPRDYSLAPPADLLLAAQRGEITTDDLVAAYRRQIMAMDAAEVYERHRDSILVCYEPPGMLCHRRILAEWITEDLGIEIEEV